MQFQKFMYVCLTGVVLIRIEVATAMAMKGATIEDVTQLF
jgi:hypothetical protein